MADVTLTTQGKASEHREGRQRARELAQDLPFIFPRFMLRLVTSLFAASADTLFHSWCTSLGIQTPGAVLKTTPESVAGRGVFATRDLKEGDVAIQIPEYCVLHEYHGAVEFPNVAKQFARKQKRYLNRDKKWWWWWRLLFLGKKYKDMDHEDIINSIWSAELTAYCLAALESGHPWAEWISQWQRDDPVHNLIQKHGVSTVLGSSSADEDDTDDDAIASCVDELRAMHPDAPKCKMRAALYIRLKRFDGLNRIFGLEEHDLKVAKNNNSPLLVSAAAMYSIVTSRAIELHSGLSGVIPFFDMINHSMSPNLELKFDGTMFELHATRDINANEELFICYHDPNREWDEDKALWTPIQWGFPDPKPKEVVPKSKEAVIETVQGTAPIERELTRS